MVKPDANKSIQYEKLIENQSFFYMVSLICQLVLYSPVRQFMTVPSVENFATSPKTGCLLQKFATRSGGVRLKTE